MITRIEDQTLINPPLIRELLVQILLLVTLIWVEEAQLPQITLEANNKSLLKANSH